MGSNYVSRKREVIPSKIFSNPFMRVEIEQVEHQYTQIQTFQSWTRNHNCTTGWWNAGRYVTLNIKDANSSVDLTQKIVVEVEGWYHIYTRVRRGPTNVGKLRLYINNDLIDEPYDCYYNSQHWKMVDFGLVYLNAGVNNFKVNADKNVWLGTFFLYKINKHDSKKLTKYGEKLDIQSLKFSQNGVSELNYLDMPITLKDKYYDEDSPSRFIFDGYSDSITLWMGENKRSTKPMFGGWLVGLDDTEDILTMKACDSLLAYYREVMLMNFAINTGVQSDTTKAFPFVSKPTVHETLRYISESSEEGINSSGLDYPYGFYWSFGTQKQFNIFQLTGQYTKLWDKKSGNPKPCLRLGVYKKPGNAVAVIFESKINPCNAANDNILSFQYMFSKKVAKRATEFNIEIDMFTEGQTSDDIITYTITFNGKKNANNIIANITPAYDGVWHTPKVDLKAAFGKYVPSENYYITGVRLVDYVSTEQVKNRNSTAIWLDNICLYDDIVNFNAKIDMEGKTAFEFMQKICTDSNCNLWVDYGNTRREDVLMMKPDNDETAPINAVPSNIISIGNVSYNLKDHNVRNNVQRMYHLKGKKKVSVTVKNKPTKYKYYKKWVVGKTKTGKPKYNYAYYKYQDVEKNELDGAIGNSESYKRYRGWENFENLTEVTREIDAERDAQIFLEEHAIAPQTFSMKMEGTSLFQPDQYLFIDYPRRRLTGLYKIKSLVHEYNPKGTNGYKWSLDVGIGLPSTKFNNYLKTMKSEINNLNDKDKRSFYNLSQTATLAGSSPGAFVGD